MFDEHMVVTLFYEPEINRFTDDFGSIIHDIHRLVTPWQIMLFKQQKGVFLTPDVTNSFIVELIYPD
jgi:hypothetical protein